MAWNAILVLARQLGQQPGTFDPRKLHPLALWRQAVRERVVQSGRAESLVGDDLRRALRPLSNHPRVKEKIAGGITGSVVRPVHGACFFIRRKDETEETLSVSKCCGLDAPRSPPPRVAQETGGEELEDLVVLTVQRKQCGAD